MVHDSNSKNSGWGEKNYLRRGFYVIYVTAREEDKLRLEKKSLVLTNFLSQ